VINQIAKEHTIEVASRLPSRIERGYSNIAWLFVLLALLTFVGFYKKYFALAPTFPGLLNIHHFHAIALSAWLALLIVQPILIARGKLASHRLLGKLSYVLAPVMFISMLMAYHHQYLRFQTAGESESFVLGFVFAPATDAIPFLIYYGLALWHRSNTPRHMRYIIATAIIIAGPGLARIFMTWMGLDVFAAIQIQVMIQLLFFLSLIIYDRRLKKRFRINPYVIAFGIWLVPNILIIFFPQTVLWQNFARWLVTLI
jgi:hypothetical protein